MLTFKAKSARTKYTNIIMQKVFDEGVEGFKSDGYNPHNPSSMKYREWERGYNRAYFTNLKKVLERENNA
jgi:hypothetical protein